jgi:hypothetical protein
LTPTLTRTSTPTPPPTATFTPTPSQTPVPTASSTFTPTPLPTDSPTATFTPTGAPVIDISAPYPNPSSGQPVTVQLHLSGSSQVKWDIFTTAFRKIAGKSNLSLPGGFLVWNLKDAQGRDAANGIYYWRLEIKDANGSRTRLVKLLVIR